MAKSEAKIQKEAINLFLKAGYLVIRHNSVRRRSSVSAYRIENTGATAGLSDVQIIKNNKAYFIEMKDSGGKQRDSQKDFEKLCEDTNNKYYICRGIDDALEILQQIKEN